MKKLILSMIMLSSISFINAQSIVSITEQNFTYSTGEKESMKVTFKDVNANDLTTALKAYFKDNYKAKTVDVKKAEGEYEVEDFKATDIQQKLTAALVRIVELEGNAALYIHYKSDGYVVSEKNTPELFPAYKTLTQNVANQAIALSFENLVELKKKELATEEKNLAVFVKAEEKNASEIVKLTSENKTVIDKIANLETDLTKQKSLVVEKAKLVIEKETEIASLNVKSIEKDIKKVESSNKKADKTISKANGTIAKYQEKIKALESNIKTVEETKITNNKQIADLQAKLGEHNEDALEDQLKLLEKDSKDAVSQEKDLTKSIAKERASIEKANVKIQEAQVNVEAAKVSQKAKSVEISTLKDSIKALETKVNQLK